MSASDELTPHEVFGEAGAPAAAGNRPLNRRIVERRCLSRRQIDTPRIGDPKREGVALDGLGRL